jgi:hypothetical protein
VMELQKWLLKQIYLLPILEYTRNLVIIMGFYKTFMVFIFSASKISQVCSVDLGYVEVRILDVTWSICIIEIEN